MSKPLAIGVLIIGSISLVMTFFLWGAAIKAGVAELAVFLDADTAAQVEQQFSMAGPGPQMQQVMMNVGQELQAKFKGMSGEEQTQMMLPALERFFTTVLPLIGSFLLLSAILWLWGRAYFLVLGSRDKGGFRTFAIEALTWMLPLLGVWILTILVIFLWVPVVAILALLLPDEVSVLIPVLGIAGIVYMIFLWPKFALAPAILIGDRTGVVESMRRSFRTTKGHWLKVLGNLIGAAAMVWIAMFVIQLVVNMVVRVADGISMLALIASLVMTLVGLIGAAYRAVFLMKLKETVHLK